MRFLKLVEPALQLLPEVAMPERKVRDAAAAGQRSAAGVGHP